MVAIGAVLFIEFGSFFCEPAVSLFSYALFSCSRYAPKPDGPMSQFIWKSLAMCLVVSLFGGGCTESAPSQRSTQDTGSQADAQWDISEEDVAEEDALAEDVSDEDIAIEDAAGEDAAGEDTAGEDAAGEDVADADEPPPEDGTIAIYLAGDLSEKTFSDGFGGQTPKEFEIALSKYDIQTSADAASAVNCFEHDEPTVANMLEDNLMGSCETAAIPSAQYTHGRVKMDWLRITVDGTLHTLGQAFPGEFTFFRAYSDTTYEGESYDSGEGWVEYRGFVTRRVPFTEPIPTEGQEGFRSEVIDGEYWQTFPFHRTMPILAEDGGQHWSRLHWEIYESFRWEEVTKPRYLDGVWDVEPESGSGGEEVKMFGVSWYYITSSAD